MCGIAGLLIDNPLIAARSGHDLRAVIHRMTDTLVARGPDAGGVLLEAPVAFGHRRLSIVELSEAGAQPMRLGSDGPILTYNGEVYNFRELRRSLEDIGHTNWRGHSDTEVILHVYYQWGLEGLKRLEGIFALALWDPAEQRLVLMRDRLGVKPLYYGDCSLGLAFGSEIKAVLAAGGVDTTLDDQALSEYLWYGNTHGDRTFYCGVRALEPGHWLIVERGQRRLQPWWRVEEWLNDPLAARNLPEAAEQVRFALDQAVARQLVADVPLGIFLSGGLDSSAIAASAIQQRSQPLGSYAAGFDFDQGINELPKAARVAKHLGLNHHVISVSGSALESVLCTLAKAHDEPFGDAANIPLYLMCQQLQGQIKVVLQGDGGDELFAGYRRYAMLRSAHWWRLWPQRLSPLMRSSMNLGRRFARMADSVGHTDPALRMAFLLTTETQQNPPEAVFLPERRRELSEATDPFVAYRQAAERFKDHEPVQQMLLTDLTVQLPSQFLRKVDRATMATGIEARVPLLDERVVRLAVNFPSIWKVMGAENKVVLRQSQRGRLPADILDGPKTGFGVPYEYWLRSSLYEFARERLLDRNFLHQFSLDGAIVEQMLVQHKNRTVERGFMLWKLLQLALFANLQTNHHKNLFAERNN
jgi:asparagine synthase (glutamine-hydrolysing)